MSTLIVSEVELNSISKTTCEIPKRPNQYFVALWLNRELTNTAVNLVQVLSELSFINRILVGLSVVELKDLQDNFTAQESINLIELINNVLVSLVGYFRLAGLDTHNFPARVFLINDWISLEDVSVLNYEIESIGSVKERLSQVIFPYELPRFIFWNIYNDSELINLGTYSFVGSKNEFSNKNNKLIQRVIYEESCNLEKFVSRLDNFNLILPGT